MDISILEGARCLGQDYRFEDLAGLVGKMMYSNGFISFTHTNVIRGGDSSIRVFSCGLLRDFIPIPSSGNVNGIVEMLLEFSRARHGARYPDAIGEGFTKGWEISEAKIDGAPVLVARAVWVPAPITTQ